jgi:hypothetical protein
MYTEMLHDISVQTDGRTTPFIILGELTITLAVRVCKT